MTHMGFHLNDKAGDYATIHQALLSGLLGHVARRHEDGDYLGARAVRMQIFPGSALRKKSPGWLVAGLLQETSRLYAHTVARIEAHWVETVAPEYLLRKHVFEPHWEKRRGQVVAYQQVTLYGLQLCARRRISFASIDPEQCRKIFLQALAQGAIDKRGLPFIAENQQLLASLSVVEDKLRRRGYVIDDVLLAECYGQRLPENILDVRALQRWWRQAGEEQQRVLFLSREELQRQDNDAADNDGFPDEWLLEGISLPLRYHFSPGDEEDGVTLRVPETILARLTDEQIEWLVPGLLQEKVNLLIKRLPKSLRRRFIPAQEFAIACTQALVWRQGELLPSLTAQLARMTGVEVPQDAWQCDKLPPHLQMRVEVLDRQSKVIAAGRSLSALQGADVPARASLAVAGREDIDGTFSPLPIERWSDIPALTLPLSQEKILAGMRLTFYPALVVQGRKINLCHLEDARVAEEAHRKGIICLLAKALSAELKRLWQRLPERQKWSLIYSRIGSLSELQWQWSLALCRESLAESTLPRDGLAWEACFALVRQRLSAVADEYDRLLMDILERYRRIGKQMRQLSSANHLQAMTDIQGQLQFLMVHGFVERVPLQRLRHFSRYLQAILLRLERLPLAPDKDRERLLVVSPLVRRARQRWPDVHAAFNDEVYWLIEELRVSLFAQPLKTAEKVSPKKIKEMLI